MKEREVNEIARKWERDAPRATEGKRMSGREGEIAGGDGTRKVQRRREGGQAVVATCWQSR